MNQIDETSDVLPDDPDARSIVVNRRRAELYAFWRDFTNLPKFMTDIKSVSEVDSISSRWTVSLPEGESAEWECMVTDDDPNRLIAWASSGNTHIDHHGRVEFHDVNDGAGTLVTASISYAPAGSAIHKVLVKLFQHEPQAHTDEDLLRFKELMETGVTPR